MHEDGSGPPLVLVHGLMLEVLGARHRLLIPDLPGSGHSDHPDVYLGPDVLAGDKLHALVPAAEMIRLDEASYFAHVDAAPRFCAAIEPVLSASR